MENLELILPEIFISLSIMFLLILGVFKKNSALLIYNLTTVTLIILLALLLNLYQVSELSIFNNSYKIDKLATFMKLLTIGSGIFVMLTSSKYIELTKINKMEYELKTLNEIEFNLEYFKEYDLKFKVDGNKLQGYVDNQLLIEAEDSSNPFEEGMMGFLTENGAIQSNSISIE